MEMKKWHFDHTKSYIELLYEAYVRIEELKVKKEDTERDEEEEEDARKDGMKEKGKGSGRYLQWGWSGTYW